MDTSAIFENKTNPNIPPLAPGDTVKVSAKIAERGKERTQVFQGVVIKLHRGADGGSFTIRKVSRGIGVEHTFPLASPRVEKVEVTRHGKVRRAKLYYLRGLSSKAARTKERQVKEQVKEAKKPEVKEAKEAQE
jgi:large subunit ribosomal protein L19